MEEENVQPDESEVEENPIIKEEIIDHPDNLSATEMTSRDVKFNDFKVEEKENNVSNNSNDFENGLNEHFDEMRDIVPNLDGG